MTDNRGSGPLQTIVSPVPLPKQQMQEGGVEGLARLLSLERHWCSSQGDFEKAGGSLSGFSLFPPADKRKKAQSQTLGKQSLTLTCK